MKTATHYSGWPDWNTKVLVTHLPKAVSLSVRLEWQHLRFCVCLAKHSDVLVGGLRQVRQYGQSVTCVIGRSARLSRTVVSCQQGSN